jgi:RNA polymerase sigma-70 factor, ECF subfamily
MNTTMPDSDTSPTDALATTLLANLGAFQSFARKRLHNDELAADAVQDSLLRALSAAPRLQHQENLLAWFYRILRNVLADLHRSTNREQTTRAQFAADAESNAEVKQATCACLRSVLPGLRAADADLVQRVDLESQDPAATAALLGVSPNTLKVRLHRARRRLRVRLQEVCQACAGAGCLDCTCDMKGARQ